MKKLCDFSNKEVRNLIISLSAEFKYFKEDKELAKVLKAFQGATKGIETEITYIDFVTQIIDSLFVANEFATWNILATITQKTVSEVQDMNNIETIGIVKDFFSIEAYKKLFSLAIESVTND